MSYRINNLSTLLILLLATCSPNPEPKKAELSFNMDEIVALAEEHYNEATQSLHLNRRMPRNAKPDGIWETVPLKDWTSGFFPGVLWQLYDYTGKEYWKEQASIWTLPLEELKDFDGHHDLGFMMFCSYGNAYKFTHDPKYLDIIVQSAHTLATRFRPEVGTILSWGDIHEENPEIHQTIIDNMMNLELIMWVANKTNDPELMRIAKTHANTTIKNQFRKDYSTYHVVVYDPADGEVINKRTHQGYNAESMWARGQSWAIYGFTMMYRETDVKKFLEQAKNAADIFFNRLPEDVIPYWDFDAPNIPDEPKDASSAAIAASALLELYQHSGDINYYNNAVELLNNLSTDKYLAKKEHYQCLLLHSVGNRNKNSEVDENIIYADYYYLEALNRLKRILEGSTAVKMNSKNNQQYLSDE